MSSSPKQSRLGEHVRSNLEEVVGLGQPNNEDSGANAPLHTIEQEDVISQEAAEGGAPEARPDIHVATKCDEDTFMHSSRGAIFIETEE